ncbi:MAG: hypothetical protein JW908_08580 [Anaerolineales bacterium]|nr:hypothetical protein [Anaerolineales bacterium]
MAMVLFKDLVFKMTGSMKRWHIESAGVWAMGGYPATINAQETMRARRLNLIDHRSQPVTIPLLNQFNLVLGMEQDHKQTLCCAFPEHAQKIHVLSEMAGAEYDIEDPVGLSIESYQITAAKILAYLEKGFIKISRLSQ